MKGCKTFRIKLFFFSTHPYPGTTCEAHSNEKKKKLFLFFNLLFPEKKGKIVPAVDITVVEYNWQCSCSHKLIGFAVLHDSVP